MNEDDMGQRCQQCFGSYVQVKPWQRFCGVKCRDAWHIAKRRAKALQAKGAALAMDHSEALDKSEVTG